MQNYYQMSCLRMHSLCPQVYSCIAQVGFDAVAPLLVADQLAVLAVVKQYVRFRQGEVWQDISAAFKSEGLQPSDEDR